MIERKEPSAEAVAIAKKLAILAAKHHRWHREIDHAGRIDIDDDPIMNDGLVSTILDILGLPKNSPVEMDMDDPDFFCRDFFDDMFDMMVVEHEDVERWVAFIIGKFEVPEGEYGYIERTLYPPQPKDAFST